MELRCVVTWCTADIHADRCITAPRPVPEGAPGEDDDELMLDAARPLPCIEINGRPTCFPCIAIAYDAAQAAMLEYVRDLWQRSDERDALAVAEALVAPR